VSIPRCRCDQEAACYAASYVVKVKRDQRAWPPWWDGVAKENPEFQLAVKRPDEGHSLEDQKSRAVADFLTHLNGQIGQVCGVS